MRSWVVRRVGWRRTCTCIGMRMLIGGISCCDVGALAHEEWPAFLLEELIVTLAILHLLVRKLPLLQGSKSEISP